ncbi:MAG TPA: alpha/beta fold hydrolase [Thermoanaerobaculia bacterium]|nr:alpha/beta fold hydrolase [Thermoanaerobaculia bacterium]
MSNPWLPYRTPRPAPVVRLFCFPYAGGAASIYRTWGRELPPEIEVYPVQPPGREGRIREAPLGSMDELVAAMDAGFGAVLDEAPFAFFGHSLGANAAYELARRRRDRGATQPTRLFASAHIAPPIPWEDDFLHDMPNPRFREKLRDLNGTPQEVLDHPELMELVEPLLRADFRVNETYEHRPGEPLDCPLTAIGGLGDEDVPREKLERWQEVTNGDFKLRMLPGDHFFLHETSKRELLDLIARELLS